MSRENVATEPASTTTMTIRELATELAPMPAPQPRFLPRWRLVQTEDERIERERVVVPRGHAEGVQWRSKVYLHKAAIVDVIPKLWEMVECGYVKVVEPGPSARPRDIGEVVVVRPPRVVMEWLRVMFMPLPQRPTISFAEAAEILGATPWMVATEVRRLGVETVKDRVFGALMSMDSLMTLVELKQRGVFGYRGKGMRKDAKTVRIQKPTFSRLELLAWLCGVGDQVERVEKGMAVEAGARYGVKLEREIARIAGLRAPARTIAAVNLLRRYADVATLAEGIHGMGGVGVVVEKHLGTLARCAFGQKGAEILEQVLDNRELEGDTVGVTGGS